MIKKYGCFLFQLCFLLCSLHSYGQKAFSEDQLKLEQPPEGQKIWLPAQACNLFSQSSADTINKYVNKNKKTGLWTVYLDQYANKTKKKNASYIGYELYDNGECVYPFSKHTRIKSYKIEYIGTTGEKGNPVPLNGTLKLLYKTGKPSYEETYQSGRPTYIKAFRWDKKGKCTMLEFLDFTKKYENTDGTFYYQLFGEDNKLLQHGYYKKGGKGWRVYFEN